MSEFKYYSLEPIHEREAHYNVIFGERSNGKTSAVLEQILRNYIETGEKGVYLRRYDDHIKGAKGERIFASFGLEERQLVKELTKGKYDDIYYRNRKWYLGRYDEELGKRILDNQEFCYAIAINTAESFKGTAFPQVTTICFDEFLSRERELIDEYIMFSNVVSTIVRKRKNVKIYLLGNTVNKFSSYFREMGLKRIDQIEQGKIQVYRFGEKDQLRVAVEYCGTSPAGKESDFYFAFDNPKLKMITEGSWEIDNYPHAPFKIQHKSIKKKIFLIHEGQVLKGNVVRQDKTTFLFFHPWTTELTEKEYRKCLIYNDEFDPRPNFSVGFMRGHKTELAAFIAQLFQQNLVFYADNEVGELVRHYIHHAENRTTANL